ncbi:MAG: cytochrome c oxidase subunit 3 [Burkholderiaceae bacterium]|nr:cytochrome c oxidase subunit 3 [Burkholderiaceae bacterium]
MSSQHANAPYYFVPGPSTWPVLAGLALLLTMAGASGWVNDIEGAWMLNAFGILCLIVILYKWFGDAIKESETGQYNERVDTSFRWSMSWFIFSEVMFFGAFFGALFYARSITMPWLGDLDHKLLWPDFVPHWGNLGPAGTIEHFTKMTPFPVPTINTALLLSSGVTLTIAHHALRAGHRKQTAIWLFLTILLGATFMGFQASEYIAAYNELNLKLSSGIYGSTFFMLTGFHGFHVTMGATMLSVVLYRVIRGDFTPERHFAFEGAAWYWHFVDVVWLGLYVVVYWL